MTALESDNYGIKGLMHLSEPGEGKLKVLWFEDKDAVDVSGPLSDFVRVTRLKVPEAAEALLDSQRAAVAGQMNAYRYQLSECPHDVYIADHRLDEAPTNEVGQPSFARSAEAAGLTSAVMMALNFPSHPATVIPYTAYQDQVKHQSDLLKRLCPDYINVVWGDGLGKLQLDVAGVLEHALKAHRDCLITAANSGVIHLRLAERARVLNELEHSCHEGSTWPERRSIAFETNWGSRRILLGALWPEEALAGVPLDTARIAAVKDWIQRFPAPDHEERAARDLADRYFWLSCSMRSSARYALAHKLRSGFGPNGTAFANLEVRKLCEQIGLESESVQAHVDGMKNGQKAAVKVAIAPEWQVPHMLNAAKKEGHQKPVVRLAVLCLLVYEEAARWDIREEREELVQQLPHAARVLLSSWCRSFVNSSGKPFGEVEIVDRLAELVNQYRSQDYSENDDTLGAITMLFGESSDVSERDRRKAVESLLGLIARWKRLDEIDALNSTFIPRLIDPLPEQLDTADGDVPGDRIGKALERIDFPSLTLLLSTANADQVSVIERRAFQTFALDLGFPKANWPAWMK